MINAGKERCGTRFATEEALITGVRSGEQEAVGCLYRHLHSTSFPSVRKLVLSRRGAAEDAEDLFQEAFLLFRRKILEGSYQYQSNTAISTYFYEIFRNKWQDELKSARRSQTDHPDEIRVEAQAETREQEMVKEEQREWVRKRVAKLGEPCMSLLKYYLWHRWDLESIADKLGVTPQSAKNQKYRCMKRLREDFLNQKGLPAL